MKLIVGLGNPGEKYTNTRHNIGFLVIDDLAKKQGISFNFEKKFEAEIGEESDAKFVKPQTFMNESGKSVVRVKDFYKIELENIIVIHDDVDLDLGKVRVSKGGSSAGHKGIQSIIDNLGTSDFWRIRVGVGRHSVIATEDWVLKNFEDMQAVNKIIDRVGSYMVELLNKETKVETFEIN
jgi:PTH1 family peptidyl-tRNA hydrolase